MKYTVKVGKVSRCTHYCARESSYKGTGKNLSVLGNPFYMKSESQRNKVLARYEGYFKGVLNNPNHEKHGTFKEALRTIVEDLKVSNVVLGCFCAPKGCHCDTIKEHVEEVLKQETPDLFMEW